MTPLAQQVARELMLPIARRSFDDEAGVLGLIGQDMHCFEVSAICSTVNDAMDADNLWPDVETMLPRLFLPSPVTWLEMVIGAGRTGLVLREVGDRFHMSYVCERKNAPSFSLKLCDFRARGPLEAGERIELLPALGNALQTLQERAYERRKEKGEKEAHALFGKIMGQPPSALPHASAQKTIDVLKARQDVLEGKADQLTRKIDLFEGERMLRRFVGMAILMLDLINTPGLVGLKQHDPHRGLAKQLQRAGMGSYPLRSWSEVVVKTHTQVASNDCHESGATFRKCLHFVRSHSRHYQTGRVSIIPAHWRGDPALGIKRTRYTVRAA